MNCPSRNDETEKHPDWNQSPSSLTADLTTRADLNGISNLRDRDEKPGSRQPNGPDDGIPSPMEAPFKNKSAADGETAGSDAMDPPTAQEVKPTASGMSGLVKYCGRQTRRAQQVLAKYAGFIGPGFLIAVAYIDPGNYATDVNGK